MAYFKYGSFLFVVFLSLALRAKAAEDPVVLVQYDFDWAVGGQESIASQVVVGGLTASPFLRGPALGPYQANFSLDGLGTQPGLILDDLRFRAPYPLETAVEAGAYFEITLTPGENHLLTVDSLTLGSRRASANTGPNFMAVRSSLDGFGENVVSGRSTAGGGGVASNSTLFDFGSAFRNLSEPLTLRIYGYARNATNTSWGIWAISNPYANATVGTGDEAVSYGPAGASPVLVKGSIFEIPEGGFLLTVGSSPGGTTDPVDPVVFFEVVATEVLALPLDGYVFESWTGDISSTNNPLVFTIDSDVTITANFGQDTADDDGDGLTNYQEIWVYGTDPNNKDTSGDGIWEGEAVAIGVNPLNDYSNFVGVVQSRPGGFGLFAESEIQDVRFGGLVIGADAEGQIGVSFSVEESVDLSRWTEHESFSSFFPVSADRRFVRVRASGNTPVTDLE